jgi:hypothetical protein
MLKIVKTQENYINTSTIVEKCENSRKLYKHFKKCGKLKEFMKTIQRLQQMWKMEVIHENHTNTSTNVENCENSRKLYKHFKKCGKLK